MNDIDDDLNTSYKIFLVFLKLKLENILYLFIMGKSEKFLLAAFWELML